MLYTKVIISKDNQFFVTQVKFKSTKYFFADFTKNSIFTEINYGTAKSFIDYVKKNRIKTGNGFLRYESERLEASFETNYEFPKVEKYDIVDTLNSSQTYFSRALGYCAYHKRYVTKQQLQTKECLVKQCNRLIRLKHPYWYEKELKNVLKKLKKQNIVV